MNHHKLARRMVRPLRDFLIGLALFSGVALSGVLDVCQGGVCQGGLFASSAHARMFTPEPKSDPGDRSSIEPTSPAGQPTLALASLAVAFATLTALNLWFARHICRVHASYRRRRNGSSVAGFQPHRDTPI